MPIRTYITYIYMQLIHKSNIVEIDIIIMVHYVQSGPHNPLKRTSLADQSVDMQEWLSKLTLELILSTAFGVDANIQVGENIEMLENAKKFFQVPPIVRRLARLPVASTIIGFLGRLRGNLHYFGDLAQHVIKTRRQRGVTGRKDLLQLMMDAHDENKRESIGKLTDDEIVAQSILFLLAGSDTTGNTLSFIVYFLAVNPDVQEKLRMHIKEAMKFNAEASLYDVAKGIEYLDCVIKETLRLCPTLPTMNRECSEAHELNGMHIPAGTEILFATYAMHHDPDAWPDPEKFDPERFRGPAKDTRHAFQFLPFGAGPRSCIAMRFALMEIKIVLVKILMKYKFERSPETQVPLDIHAGFTLMAKDGVLVRVCTI